MCWRNVGHFISCRMQLTKQEDHFFFSSCVFKLNNFQFIAELPSSNYALHFTGAKVKVLFAAFPCQTTCLDFSSFMVFFLSLLGSQTLTHTQSPVQPIWQSSLRLLREFFNFTIQFSSSLSQTLQVIPLFKHWASLLQSLDFPFPMQLLPPLLY